MVVTPSRQNLVQGVGNDPTSMAFQTITNPSQLTLHNMVGVVGFEPTTPCSQSTCANQAALHTDESLWKIRSVQYFVCYLSELLHTDFHYLATGLGIEPSQYGGQSTMPSHLANL